MAKSTMASQIKEDKEIVETKMNVISIEFGVVQAICFDDVD